MPPLTGLAATVQDVFLSLLRAAEALKQDLDELLKPAGLSPTQYNVLRVLRGAGREGLTCHEIIRRMVTRDPDMTRLLDRLESRGLVVRERSREDRRVVCTCLTEAGLRLVEELDEPVAQLHIRQLGHLGERDLRSLGDKLRRILDKPA